MVLVWFTFLAITGIMAIGTDWTIFEAINPIYGIEFLFSAHNRASLAIMVHGLPGHHGCRGFVLRYGSRGSRQYLRHLAIH